MCRAPLAVLAVSLALGCGGGAVQPPAPRPCAEWCSGCCTPDGSCKAGYEDAACGALGAACAICAPQTICGEQACTPVVPDAGSAMDAGQEDAGQALAVTLRWRYSAPGVCREGLTSDDVYMECAATRTVSEARVQGLWYDNYFGCKLSSSGRTASIDCSQNCQDSSGYCAAYSPDGGPGRTRTVIDCWQPRFVPQLNVCSWEPSI